MSDLTPSKLKVVELRAELQARGLETKGIKAVLVDRLEDALLKEEKDDIPASKDNEENVKTNDEKDGNDKENVELCKEDKEVEKEDEEVEKEDEQVKKEDEEVEKEDEEVENEDEVLKEDEGIEKEEEEDGAEKEGDEEWLEDDVEEEFEEQEVDEESKKVSETIEGTANDNKSKDEQPEIENNLIANETQPEKDVLNNSNVDNVVSESNNNNIETPLEEGENKIDSDVAKEISKKDDVDNVKCEESDEKMDEETTLLNSTNENSDSLVEDETTVGSGTKRKRSQSRSPSRPSEEVIEENDELKPTTIPEKIGHIHLDLYNSDLNLIIDSKGLSATPLGQDGFAFVWAGARTSHGIASGKICFEVKLIEHLKVQLPPDEVNPHVVRVGFSVDDSSMQLGEEKLSYGFGGTGKASTDCQFKEYGQSFISGDVITSFLNMDDEEIEISFAKNGEHLGIAYSVPKGDLEGRALFPHILTKNVSFCVNLGQMSEPFFELPSDFQDYTFIGNVCEENCVRGSLSPANKSDCEVIMMCGLPGSGKTTWALKHSLENPQKKYNILGTNSIIDKMRVMGLSRKRNYSGRWDVLIQMSTRCLTKLLELASRRKRNYIIDQTNVYPSAQRRKMRSFDGFKKVAAVIVPTNDQFLIRIKKREDEEGKDVPNSAVLDMKANFSIPQEKDIFDEILFVELDRVEAEELVSQYNQEGESIVGKPQKRQRLSETPPSWGAIGAPPLPAGASSRNQYSGGGGGGGSGGGGGQSRSHSQHRDHRNNSGNDSRPSWNHQGGSRGGGGFRGGQRGNGGFQGSRGGGGYQNQRGNGGNGGGNNNYHRGNMGGGGGGGGGGGYNNRGGQGGGPRGHFNSNRGFSSGGGGGGGGRYNERPPPGGGRGGYSSNRGGGGQSSYNNDYRNSPNSGGLTQSGPAASVPTGGGYAYNGQQSERQYNQNTSWNTQQQQQQGYSGGQVYSQPQQQQYSSTGYNQSRTNYGGASGGGASYQGGGYNQSAQVVGGGALGSSATQALYSSATSSVATPVAAGQGGYNQYSQQQQQQQQTYAQTPPSYQSYYSGNYNQQS